jgi:hypothetical protein
MVVGVWQGLWVKGKDCDVGLVMVLTELAEGARRNTEQLCSLESVYQCSPCLLR